MKTILVPTDLSEHAKNALRIAAEVALKNNSRILLLNSNELPVYSNPLGEYNPYDRAFDESYQQEVRAGLQAAVDTLKSDSRFADTAIETAIEPGSLVALVETTIDEKKVDLVVMGTHGARGMQEVLIGSNTQKVIRYATCPVLSIPLSFSKTGFTTVVFPTTLQADQAVAFRRLAAFQRQFNFAVSVLYLNDPAGLKADEAVEQRALSMAEAAGLQNVDVFASAENVFNEEEAILNFANEQKADLIAMGTHQRTGLSHLIFGSITEDTINHATIPVLSIPLH
nr:universal stress protein [uncultured Arsenicibacter sp.]